MHVFLTGATGLIGSRVARGLIDEQHEVTALIHTTRRAGRLADLDLNRVGGDIHDTPSLVTLMEECDTCIHLASTSGWDQIVGPGVEHSVLDGTRSVVEAAGRAGVRRLVYGSSAAAINGSSQPTVFDESSPFELDPTRFDYAWAKRRAEAAVLAACGTAIPEVVIVNPVETFGPDDVDEVTAGTVRRFLDEWPVVVVPGGTSVAHVDDVAAGIAAAATRGRSGHRYILGGDNITITDLARLALRAAGRRTPVITVPRATVDRLLPVAVALHLASPIGPGLLDYASMYWYTTSAKAERELGYRSRPAAEIVAPVVAWLRRETR